MCEVADNVNPSDTDISASDLTTLNGKRIGVVPDTLSASQFCEWEKSHGVDTQQVDISSTDDARQKLHNQEIDGFVLNEYKRCQYNRKPVYNKEGASWSVSTIS